MRARIYQKAKTAMQSGRADATSWVLEFPRHDRAIPDRLMGWQSSGDTLRCVHLYFDTADAAAAYADSYGIEYTIYRSGSRRPKRRAYADNFAFTRNGAWTH